MIRPLFGILTAGFLLSQLQRAEGAEVMLTEHTPPRNISLKQGDHLVVRLPANRTTGYGWVARNAPSGIVRSQGEIRYEPTQSAHRGVRDPVGRGGTEVAEFLAVNPGRTTLRFSYERAWEKGVPPARIIIWKIIVR